MSPGPRNALSGALLLLLLAGSGVHAAEVGHGTFFKGEQSVLGAGAQVHGSKGGAFLRPESLRVQHRLTCSSAALREYTIVYYNIV